jgi:DNA-directed RNA polymerase specialized sigma24 family protein
VEKVPLPSETQLPEGMEDSDDQTFDTIWMIHLVNRAFEQLKKECLIKKSLYYDAVRMSVLEHADYAKISKELSVEPTNVKNLIHRGKQRLLDYVREEIAAYCHPGSQYENEVHYLMRYLGDGAP